MRLQGVLTAKEAIEYILKASTRTRRERRRLRGKRITRVFDWTPRQWDGDTAFPRYEMDQTWQERWWAGTGNWPTIETKRSR